MNYPSMIEDSTRHVSIVLYTDMRKSVAYLKGKYRLRMFENKMTRRIFLIKRE
jgi:hypothetical protein